MQIIMILNFINPTNFAIFLQNTLPEDTESYNHQIRFRNKKKSCVRCHIN